MERALPAPVAEVVGALLATPGITSREICHAAELVRVVALAWGDGRRAQSWLAASDVLERIAPVFDPPALSSSVAEQRRRAGATLLPRVTYAAQPTFAVFRNMPPPYAKAGTLEEARVCATAAGEQHPDSFLTVLQVLETHHLSTRWPDPDSENLP